MWGSLSNFFFVTLVLLFGLNSVCQSASSEIEKFKNSWVAKALSLQRDIDLNTPINQATFIGTHNSENSKYYSTIVSYLDPNQTLSIYDQLELGIRSIELDIHWTFDAHAKQKILLCHAQRNHIGCSPFDRPFVEGLIELRDWLKANPHEIVLLYLDRSLDGHEPRASAELNAYLGDFIFKPTQIRAGNAVQPQPVCTSLPATLTRADVLRAGKQLIIVANNCDGFYPQPAYQETDIYTQPWNDSVFAGIGKTYRNPFTFLDATMNSFTPFPDCGYTKEFFDDPGHTSMWRIFEDRTILSNLEHPQRKLLAEDMKELLRCGINWPTMDMLSIDDERLTAAIWSWAPSYPIEGKGRCAIYKKDQGIQNVRCDELARAYACQKNLENQWRVTQSVGQWSQGEALCQSQIGKEWHFSMPVNGQQMSLLKESAGAMAEVWLNYVADNAGRWQANK